MIKKCKWKEFKINMKKSTRHWTLKNIFLKTKGKVILFLILTYRWYNSLVFPLLFSLFVLLAYNHVVIREANYFSSFFCGKFDRDIHWYVLCLASLRCSIQAASAAIVTRTGDLISRLKHIATIIRYNALKLHDLFL